MGEGVKEKRIMGRKSGRGRQAHRESESQFVLKILPINRIGSTKETDRELVSSLDCNGPSTA